MIITDATLAGGYPPRRVVCGGGGTIPKNVLAMTAPVLLVSGELTEMLAGFLALIGVPATRLNGGCY